MQSIQVKVIGLAWRGEQILVFEVEDSQGRVKGLRPLGGCVEFGETREEALRREFREELGCETSIEGEWHAFENIYQHEGATGHEYVFAARIGLGDPAFYRKDAFNILESDGNPCRVRWQNPRRLPEGVELYPSALHCLIEQDRLAD